ncbi:coiled-coil domain-containing protein 170-like [Acipenser oxyrinchus oxyrinchus]|uniref:Coiled-coil domain-containing protein 170-like n=1 Tax=Acipenser oxyrinchus oxyrinchus TaxID=40147 RepID=A0AAD8GCA0_ACIOX|nr:coiled-coil domain-containing protein 170-like [Acipenser oxyrinchus oxyrinchus]
MSNHRPDSALKLIDVSRNDAFRSFSPTSLSNRTVNELQEQISVLKRQLEEKEELILSLTTGSNASRPDYQKEAPDSYLEMPVTREHLNHYRLAAEAVRSELAALQVKYECASTELQEVKSRLASRETSVHELKGEMESYKENNARQASLISSLRKCVQETEQETGAMASSKNRAEISLHTVSKENSVLKERVEELEGKLRKYINEWDDTKQEASSSERKYKEFLVQLASRMDVECRGRDDPQDFIVSQLDKLYNENTRQKCRIASLEETVSAHEVESKASRETVMRLVSEVGREQRAAASFTKEVESLRQELENTILAKRSLERENRALQERLEATRRAWEASRLELGTLEKQSKELDGSLRSSLCEAKSNQSLLQAFKEELAALLSGRSGTVHPTEEAIKERIQEICSSRESQKESLSQMEVKASRLTDQLERQTELHEAALQRARQTEEQLGEIRERLSSMEGELVSGDVFRDGLSHEKQNYMRFLDELSEKMKLDRVVRDLGFDMRLDAIQSRAEQLVKLESNAVVENKTLAHNLNRKLKTQKEQLESKELHMELLRKKIAQLEEEKRSRTALAVERDEANLTVRRLQKKVERLQKELGATRLFNTDLKSKLSDTNELKIKTLEQNKTIEEMNKSLDKVEKVKVKMEKRLTSVKSALDFTEHEAKEERQRTHSLLEAVTSELATLKHTMGELAKRERQLVDFRQVVSRMLGLNVSTLALPDYEIIRRLEKLIQGQHSHRVACLCLDNSREQLNQDFTTRYNHARGTLTTPSAADKFHNAAS